MAYRTINIKNRGKLSYSLNYLIFRGGEKEVKVHLSEVSTLIVENTACVITLGLITELVKRKIKVIFCDSKRHPQSELMGYYGSHNTSLRLKQQIEWKENTKKRLWKRIVEQKIKKQAIILMKYGYTDSYQLLTEYSANVKTDDETNREGHAAKVYFNQLFGKDFSRAKEILTNVFLNYGYTIILSSFNRSIVAHGYSTQLGIHHCSEYNPFNLSCDFMEPFRPIVDDFVVSGKLEEEHYKKQLINLLNIKMKYRNQEYFLENVINQYVLNLLNCLGKDDFDKLYFYDSYEL